MNDFDADGIPDGEWEDQGELAWNEFDWEEYLRLQDKAVARYLAHYDRLHGNPERIDEAARLMGWDNGEWSGDIVEEPNLDAAAQAPDDYDDLEPYSVHRNPVFVATKAIFLGLRQRLLALPDAAGSTSPGVARELAASFHQAEDGATMAIQALDLGDYAMAISLFKRALRELNAGLALTDRLESHREPRVQAFAVDSRMRLFDLREICLRIMQECRNELTRPIDDEG